MLQEMVRVIQEGDESGNGMIIRLPFPSGLEIIGLATKNSYGGDWDFGPSWNYVVFADKAFLLDTGRVGMGSALIKMLDTAGVSKEDLDFLVVSHGHEDHDGGRSGFRTANGLSRERVTLEGPLVAEMQPDQTRVRLAAQGDVLGQDQAGLLENLQVLRNRRPCQKPPGEQNRRPLRLFHRTGVCIVPR